MKKIIFLAITLLSTLNICAQREEGTFTIQPKVGLNISNGSTSSDNLTRVSPRLGLAAGVEAEYQVSRILSLSAGALYSMQGIKGKTTITIISLEKASKTEFDDVIKLDYITVPIMANFYVTKGLAVKFGVQPAFLVHNGYKVSSSQKGDSGKLTDIGYELNTFDFSIPVGISGEYSNVVLDARYNIGVTKITKNYGGRNSVFQFTLGYKFEL
ncbi:MAG: PorT family protein [Bacteroidaceae bacterium]|nr:PorT family protein [Bacteroidaceae bacterium]